MGPTPVLSLGSHCYSPLEVRNADEDGWNPPTPHCGSRLSRPGKSLRFGGNTPRRTSTVKRGARVNNLLRALSLLCKLYTNNNMFK